MRRMLRIQLVLLLSLAAGVLYAEIQLPAPWMDRDYVYNHDPFESILVIGVPDHPDKRRQLENSLVKALEKNGVQATASLDIMSEDTEINRDTVTAALAGRDVDAMFLASLHRVEDIEIVSGGVLPKTQRTERDFALQLWQDSQGTYDQNLAALRKEKHRLVLENKLYNLKNEKLVWSVQSYSMKPGSADEAIRSLIKQVAATLRRDGVI